MATAGSDYLIGNNLEDLYELLKGGFLEDHIVTDDSCPILRGCINVIVALP